MTMKPSYWALKFFDLAGLVLVLWASGPRLAPLVVGGIGWLIASVCATVEASQKWSSDR